MTVLELCDTLRQASGGDETREVTITFYGGDFMQEYEIKTVEAIPSDGNKRSRVTLGI